MAHLAALILHSFESVCLLASAASIYIQSIASLYIYPGVIQSQHLEYHVLYWLPTGAVM